MSEKLVILSYELVNLLNRLGTIHSEQVDGPESITPRLVDLYRNLIDIQQQASRCRDRFICISDYVDENLPPMGIWDR